MFEPDNGKQISENKKTEVINKGRRILLKSKTKKVNKIIPNQYAIRGFDITFDILLRLSQDNTFEETIQTSPSEQIENKFDYVQNATYGYTNNGIYILYYDTDLTIKEAL